MVALEVIDFVDKRTRRGGASLKPIERAALLVFQVYDYLKDAILTGKLAPGERVVERKLAEQLQVSRSPVREAIRLLITEHLLVERDGVAVFQPTLEDFNEIYELRLAIEPMAARNAAKSITPATIQVLQMNWEDTKRRLEVGDTSRIVDLNQEFHRTIWSCSKNSRFCRIMDTVSAVTQYYWIRVLNIVQTQTNIVQEHADILSAIVQGDESRAYDAMFHHISRDMTVINELREVPSVLTDHIAADSRDGRSRGRDT